MKHDTTFPDKLFDRVVGNGILHHLELPAAMTEVDRILKPGKGTFPGAAGLSVFLCEAGYPS